MCLEKVQAELRTAPAPIAVRMHVPIKNQSKLLPNVKMRFKSCLVSHEDMEEEHKTHKKIRHLRLLLSVDIALDYSSAHTFSGLSHGHVPQGKELKKLAEKIRYWFCEGLRCKNE